jgi:hypothetical protein
MNQIKQIKQCLPVELIDIVEEYVRNSDWKYGWRSNKTVGFSHWNQDFGRGGTENTLDISGNLSEPLVTVWNHLRTQHFPNSILIRCYANAHTFGVEGYPHTDSSRDQDSTVVLYLNKTWRREWGGETMVYNQDSIAHAELPKYNTALVFPGNQWHVAKPVSRICPELRVTLMFKVAPMDADPTRDNIQRFLVELGTNKIKHRNSSLMAHLLRTYDSLKEQRYSDVICSAGGLHSIFGTNVFQHQTLTMDSRARVAAVIGEEATELVELFSTISRPQTLETALSKGNQVLRLNSHKDVKVTQEQLNSLCAIEAANLKDQNSLEPYENIKKFYIKPE